MGDNIVRNKYNDSVLYNTKITCEPIVQRGLRFKNRAIECYIWQWRNSLLRLREGKLVTKNEVQNYAREIYVKAGILNFKASDGWYRRWLSRWTKSVLYVTEKDEKLGLEPVNLESKKRKIPNKNRLKKCQINLNFKEHSKTSKSIEKKLEVEKEVIKNTIENGNFKECVICEPDVCNHITLNRLISRETRSKCHNLQSDSGSKIPLELELPKTKFEILNFDTEKVTNNITNIRTSSEENCNTSQSKLNNFQQKIIKDTNHFRNISFADDFLNRHIVNSSRPSNNCDNQYENFVPRNINKKSSHNSEIFFSNNFENHPQKDSSIFTLSFSENPGLLNSDIGKEKTNSVSKNVEGNKVYRKGERYLPHFKLKVATYAAANTIKTAAVKFNVNRKTVSEWLKEKAKNSSPKSSAKTLLSTENNELADSHFIKWLESHQDKLSHNLLKTKTWELFEEYGEDILQKTCPWFLSYIKRLNETKFEQKISKKKYILYPEKFKLQVVKYAEKFSQIAAARLFYIARKRIFDWFSKVNNTGSVKTKNFTNPSSFVTDPEIDNQISIWYKEQPVPPSSKQVRDKGRQLYGKAGYTLSCSYGWYYRWRLRFGLPSARNDDTINYSSLLEWILIKLDNNQHVCHSDLVSEASKFKKSIGNIQFKPSLGWAFRFCKRYQELLQAVPGISTPLTPTMEIKVQMFKNNLLSCTKEKNIAVENVVSMDEIPLHFSLTGNNKRKLLIRRPGFDTCQGSLVISSLGNGTLLPFMLILKGSKSESTYECSGPNSFVISEKGCIDADIMFLWLQQVFLTRIINSGILINDCFEPHICDKVVKELALHKIQHFVIPGGCSSRLQPLNNVSQQLKSRIEQYWTESVTECWTNCHLEPPSHKQIIDWVQKSYSFIANIEKEHIRETFQKIFSLEGKAIME